MANQDRNVKVTFTGIDKVTKVASGVDKSLDGITESAEQVANSFDSMGDVSMGSMDGMTGAVFKGNLAVTALVGAVGVAGKAVKWGFETMKKAAIAFGEAAQQVGESFIELSERGGKIEDVTVGFQKNFKDTTKALGDLREASGGTISDFDLMLSANKAAMLGVTTDSEELARLLEIARGRAQALGIDTTQAFSDIVTGIGRSSPLILDNLGITTAKYKEQMKALEDRGIILDDAQKKEILLASVLDDTSQAVDTATTRFDIMRAGWTNLTDEIAKGAATTFTTLIDATFPNLIDSFSSIGESISGLTEGAVTWLGEKINAVRTFFTEWWEENRDTIMPIIEDLKWDLKDLASALGDMFNPSEETKESLKGLLTEGVEALVGMLEGDGGLIDLFTTFIEKLDDPENIDEWTQGLKDFNEAMNNIKSVISWFLDRWDTIEALFEGMGKAKNSSFNKGLVDIAGGKSPVGVGNIGGLYNVINGLIGDKKASGGYSHGGMTLVGENGPELVHLPKGSRVSTNEQSKGMMGNNVTINVTGNTIDSSNRVQEIVMQIQNAMARENRLANLSVI